LTVDQQRRDCLRAAVALPLAPAGAFAAFAAKASDAPTLAPPRAPLLPPEALAKDEAYWAQVAKLYDISDEVVLLDNGYWGSMARPVLDAYTRYSAEINRSNSWYGRTRFPAQFQQAHERTAAALGVRADEIVLTRGATEALMTLVGGYKRLRDGDVVLYADIDYDCCIDAMRALQRRRGVTAIAIAMPEPATHEALIECYRQAILAHPRLKLMLLTHVNHRNGMVLPVAEISRMARQRGIDVIVDTAHGFGQLDMRIPDLEADFVAINLHKWIGAPVGTGAVYIKRPRIPDIDVALGSSEGDDIALRVHTGTVNFAAFMALPQALDLHEQIGVANKQARLRRLRQLWVEPAREIAGIDVLASPDPRLTSAIASFRLSGRTKLADNVAVAKRLLNEAGIFTVHRDGLASGACVRVTPSVFTSEAQMAHLVEALRAHALIRR
jgi:isopenicillin-N epimerase